MLVSRPMRRDSESWPPSQALTSIEAGVGDRGFLASGLQTSRVARIFSAAARPTEVAAVGRGGMAHDETERPSDGERWGRIEED
jgi:hypothetical protein